MVMSIMPTMDMRLFCYENRELNPEARWLLLQWSRVAGLDNSLTYPQAELYGRLGLPAQHARAALALLKEQGHVICGSDRHGRGRPVSSYSVSAGLLGYLERVEAPVTAHEPEIESLCDHAITTRASQKQNLKNQMSGEQRANMLVPATYWLLGVLMAHAEAPGIVRNLSYGRLLKVTGMTRERLKSQLSKLKKLGVIKRHEPGVLRRREDARMRSVYVLNLEHPLLLGEESVGLRVVIDSVGSPRALNYLSGFYEAALMASRLDENYERVLEEIEAAGTPAPEETDPATLLECSRLKSRYADAYERLLQCAMSLLPPLKLLEPISGDILKMHRLGMGPSLKAHVRSYAMTMLSNHWADLEDGRRGVDDPISAVMLGIQRDCAYLPVAEDIEGREGESGSSSPFFTFVYALAHHIAVQLQGALKLIERQQADCDFHSAAFMIEQSGHRDYECWSLKVCFRDSEGTTELDDTWLQLPGVNLTLPEGIGFLGSEEQA